MRVRNGTGTVYMLHGKRTNPYRAAISSGMGDKGQTIYKTIGFYPTKADGYVAIVRYHMENDGDDEQIRQALVAIGWLHFTDDEYTQYAKKQRQRYVKNYYEDNKHEMIKQASERHKEKRNNDSDYRLVMALRHRVKNLARGSISSAFALRYLGCTAEHARKHLESQFRDGMTWGNHGEWHIDHIVPCAAFDLTKEEEKKACFHYTNLQPLWALANIKKGGRLPHEIENYNDLVNGKKEEVNNRGNRPRSQKANGKHADTNRRTN